MGTMTSFMLMQNLRRRWRAAPQGPGLVLSVPARGPDTRAVPGLLLGLLIHLDSAGPVLYRQRRLGRTANPSTVFKFRTAAPGCGQVLASIWRRIGLREEWEKKTIS